RKRMPHCLRGACRRSATKVQVVKARVCHERPRFLGHLKLFPEDRCFRELLNQATGCLGKKCGQETDASQQGSADDAQRACHSEDSEYSSEGRILRCRQVRQRSFFLKSW